MDLVYRSILWHLDVIWGQGSLDARAGLLKVVSHQNSQVVSDACAYSR